NGNILLISTIFVDMCLFCSMIARMLQSAWIKTIVALTLIILLIIGCNTATPIPFATATLANDNPTSGAILRETQIARATQDAESTANAQATLDESATQAAERATQTEQARLDATATVVAQATRDAILATQATWPKLVRDSFSDNHLKWPIG